MSTRNVERSDGAVPNGALLVCLLLAGIVVGAMEMPYQWLSSLGFRIQSLWPLGSGRPLQATLVAIVPVTTFVFCMLAWGPLRMGRGGGVTGIQELQQANLSPEAEAAAEASLSIRVQLHRLPLMVLTHLSGLTVGTESPSASLGATILSTLSRCLRPLQAIPTRLLTAIGGGAGMAAAFCSPLLGVTYALGELCPTGGLPLVLPCLLVGGVGAFLHIDSGSPALALGAVTGGLPLGLWPHALALTVVASMLGMLFKRVLHSATRAAHRVFGTWRFRASLGAGLILTGLALLSGGVSLNDGQLILSKLLNGVGEVSPLQLIARFLASAVSIAIGAPGGLMHDTMTMGTLVSCPFSAGQVPAARGALAAIGAAAVFSGAVRVPLFCAVFVFQLQGDANMLTPLLLCSALATALSMQADSELPHTSEVKHAVDSPRKG